MTTPTPDPTRAALTRDERGWPVRMSEGGVRLCARRGVGHYGDVTEFRINGYCSVECEDMAEVEHERDAARAEVARLSLSAPSRPALTSDEELRERFGAIVNELRPSGTDGMLALRERAAVRLVREQTAALEAERERLISARDAARETCYDVIDKKRKLRAERDAAWNEAIAATISVYLRGLQEKQPAADVIEEIRSLRFEAESASATRAEPEDVSELPQVGELWRSKDPRDNGRLVRIQAVTESWVTVRNHPHGRCATSRPHLFVKRYEKVESAARERQGGGADGA